MQINCDGEHDMKAYYVRFAALCAVLLLILGCSPADDEMRAGTAEDLVSGLWAYTGLTTSGGDEMPLTGIFLFHDGVFMQQSIFDGEPFEDQRVMAHTGPYAANADSVTLFARQQIFVAPDQDAPLDVSADHEHQLTISRDGDELTLVFGSGTVQTFERVGPGLGSVYSIESGAFALVDDHFILVQGTSEGTVNGYGTYTRDGNELELQVTRWSEATPDSATNLRDVTLQATFDGVSLALEDGREYRVVR